MTVPAEDGRLTPPGFKQSKAIWEHLKSAGYIDASGKVQEPLKTALKDGTLTLPEPFVAQLDQVMEVLKKITVGLAIASAGCRAPPTSRRRGSNGARPTS